MCGRHIQQGLRILEVGSGPASPTSKFLAGIGPVAGVDVSDEVLGNHWLTEAHVYDGNRLPFPNAAFAACVSDYVVEHIEYPGQHFREVARVLVPGGVYCFRTPNLWHYVALASRLLPRSAQLRLANQLRGLSSEAHDPYATFYRANTIETIRNLGADAGLQISELILVEKEPSYGRASAALLLPMMAYERFVNRFGWLGRFRANIFAVARNPETRCQ